MVTSEKFKTVRAVIASNYTVRPVEKALYFWAKKLGYTLELSFPESLYLTAQLLDKNSLFYDKGVTANFILFRFENCFASVDDEVIDIGLCETFILVLKDALIYASKNCMAPITVVEGPPSKELLASDPEGKVSVLRAEFAALVECMPGVDFISKDYLFDLYPMDNYHDEHAYAPALMPYSRECYMALGTIVSRRLASHVRKPMKVIVLDCDNTLWKGVAAEDGVSGVVIDEHFVAVQTYMVNLLSKGFLLCLCSKNVEHDVWAIFDHHRNTMPLKKAHIASYRINWKSKSENLLDLSRELNLGLDSFVLLDDNPFEVVEVETMYPEVKCLQVPKEISETVHLLKHTWEFDVPKAQVADSSRTKFYQRETKRRSSASQFESYDDFLRSLNLELTFRELSAELVGRASQMTYRTNQFNFSGVKLNELEVSRREGNPFSKCMLINAKDRFGDYGTVGCLMYTASSDSIYLENFLLSCRALGKKIEFQIWEWLCDTASKRGLMKIDICFHESTRNVPAQKFLTALGIDINDFNSHTYSYEIMSIPRPKKPELTETGLQDTSRRSYGTENRPIRHSVNHDRDV